MKPVLLLGGGGHATVVLDALLASQQQVIGFLDSNPKINAIFGLSRLGTLDDHAPNRYKPGEVMVACGIGSTGDPTLRESIFALWKQHGFQFITLRHPDSTVARGVKLGEGVQLMAGTVVQARVSIGENSIINTRASVDHDCVIGAHVHVAPGATLSGAVRVMERVHIGPGATVVQGIKVGANSIVGAGSVVVDEVPADTTVMGVPAKNTKG